MASSSILKEEANNARITQITQLLLAGMEASFNSRLVSGHENEDRKLAEDKVKSAVQQILRGVPAAAHVQQQQPQLGLAEGQPGEGQQPVAAIPSASGASSSSAPQQPPLFNDEWELEKTFMDGLKGHFKYMNSNNLYKGHVLLGTESTLIQGGFMVTIIEGAEDADTPVAQEYRRASRIIVSVSGRGQKARVKLVGELLKDGVFEELYVVNTTMDIFLSQPPARPGYYSHADMHISAVDMTNPGHKLAKLALYLSTTEPTLRALLHLKPTGPCGFTIPEPVQKSAQPAAKMHRFQLEMLDMKTERARLVGGLWHPETPIQEGGYEKYVVLTGTLDELMEQALRFGYLIKTSMRL
jgi:hypothetical protein